MDNTIVNICDLIFPVCFAVVLLAAVYGVCKFVGIIAKIYKATDDDDD